MTSSLSPTSGGSESLLLPLTLLISFTTSNSYTKKTQVILILFPLKPMNSNIQRFSVLKLKLSSIFWGKYEVW